MPTTEQILNLHEQKASNALSRISTEFNNGTLSLESDILNKITQEYIDFFTSLGKPTLEPVTMNTGDLLRLSSLVNPLYQLDDDLNIAYSQVENIRLATKNMINLCMLERDNLNNKVSEVVSKTKMLQLWVPDTSEELQWVGDTLSTESKIDETLSSTWFNNKTGAITLKPISSIDLNDQISDIIIYPTFTDSTHPEGMPGNMLEIYGTGYSDSPDTVKEPTSIVPAGSTYIDSSLPRNMVDGDPSTWFEWEKYMVPAVQKLKPVGRAFVPEGTELTRILGTDSFSTKISDTGGTPEYLDLEDKTLGFGWKAYIKWPNSASEDSTPYYIVHPWAKTDIQPSKEQSLSLTFSIELETPQNINWLSLTPYMAGQKGTTVDYEILESVVAVYGNNSEQKELLSQPLKLNSNIQVPIDKASGIPVTNVAGIAVIPCNVEKVKRLIFKLKQEINYQTKIGHVFYLKEEKYQSTFWRGLSKRHREDIKHFRVAAPIENNPVRTNVKGLFGLGGNESWTTLSINKYYDVFNAYRYCIGIKDISLLQREYTQTGMMQSTAHYFEKEVSAASIITGEVIPEDWPVANWISYQISHDGETWKNIIPQKSTIENSVVEFPPTKKLYLRAYFTRPNDKPNQTPCLTYYAIKAIPVVN